MGNFPSADLGGGSAHSSRDVRTANPEKEVKRSLASRAPTHNKYTELPASSKPHNSTAKVSIEVNGKLPAMNTTVQLLTLYIDCKSHNAQRYTDG